MAGNTSNRKKNTIPRRTSTRKKLSSAQKQPKKTTPKKVQKPQKTNKIKVPIQKNKQHIVKKMPAPKGSYKVFTIMIFLFFTIYLCGYIWVFLNRPSVPVEMVTYGSIESASSLKGLFIREEYVVTSDRQVCQCITFLKMKK